MIHYELTKENSLIYAADGLYGIIMIRPYKVFNSGFEQLPSIRMVHPHFFEAYYNSHKTSVISRSAFEKLYIDVTAFIMDYDKSVTVEMMKIWT